MSQFKNLTGLQFGRLKVIKRGPNNKDKTRWICECECGHTTLSYTHSLLSGKTKSCGCLSHEIFIQNIRKHGMRKTRIYSIWCGMKNRCFCDKYEYFHRYGGRGITICDEWLGDNGFINFYKWAMANGYADNLEIDRVDVNGNYCPENCRWETRTSQVRNRRTTVFIVFNGTKKTLKEWCDVYDVNYKTAYQRYKKGLSFKEVFNILESDSYV